MLPFTEPIILPPTWGVVGPISVAGSSLLTAQNVLTSEGVCLLSAIVTFLFFVLLYKSSRFWTPLLAGDAYRSLPHAQRRDWDSRWSNLVYPPLVVALSLMDKLYSPPVPEGKVLTTTTDLSSAVMGISIGFFIVDSAVMGKYQLGGMPMFVHHLMSMIAFVCSIYTGECHTMATWLLLTEFTTPFITAHWWLDKLKLKGSILNKINGLGLLISWFVFRVVVFVPFYITIWHARRELLDLSYALQAIMAVVPLGMTLLNVFWFTKIVRGFIKLFSSRPHGSQSLPVKQE